jgi:hypothetical protein
LGVGAQAQPQADVLNSIGEELKDYSNASSETEIITLFWVKLQHQAYLFGYLTPEISEFSSSPNLVNKLENRMIFHWMKPTLDFLRSSQLGVHVFNSNTFKPQQIHLSSK